MSSLVPMFISVDGENVVNPAYTEWEARLTAACAEEAAARAAEAAATEHRVMLEAAHNASVVADVPVPVPDEPVIPEFIKNVAAYVKQSMDKGMDSVNAGNTYTCLLQCDKVCGLDARLEIQLEYRGLSYNLEFVVYHNRDLANIVFVPILYSKKYKTVFHPSDSLRVLNLRDYEIFMSVIYDTLPKLNINTRTCRIQDTEPNNIDVDLSEFLDHPTIECIRCCVCSVRTMGIYTRCDHTVCLTCFDSITPCDEENEHRQQNIPCPLCREAIGWYDA